MMLCKDVAEDIQSCKEHIHYATLSLKEKISALKNIMPLVLVTAVLRIGFLSLAIYNITSSSNDLAQSQRGRSLEQGICNISFSKKTVELSQKESDYIQIILASLQRLYVFENNNISYWEQSPANGEIKSIEDHGMSNTELFSLFGLVVVFFGPVIPIYFLIQKYKTTTKIVSFNDCAVGMMSEVSFLYNWSLLSPEIGRKIQLFLNMYISCLGVGYSVYCTITAITSGQDGNLLYAILIMTCGIMQIPLYLLEYSYGFLEKPLETQSSINQQKSPEIQISVIA